MVRDDFPEPETPVTTISLLRGKDTSTFLRLWTLAPFINIASAGCAGVTAGDAGVTAGDAGVTAGDAGVTAGDAGVSAIGAGALRINFSAFFCFTLPEMAIYLS